MIDDDEDERVTMPVNEEGVKDVHKDVMKVEEFFSELNIRVEENENSEYVSKDSTEDIKPFQSKLLVKDREKSVF